MKLGAGLVANVASLLSREVARARDEASSPSFAFTFHLQDVTE